MYQVLLSGWRVTRWLRRIGLDVAEERVFDAVRSGTAKSLAYALGELQHAVRTTYTLHSLLSEVEII